MRLTTEMMILQLSMGRGWQKGIKSEVRFTAMVPATMAVLNTGPFALVISVTCLYSLSESVAVGEGNEDVGSEVVGGTAWREEEFGFVSEEDVAEAVEASKATKT